jgi:uncharacterized paraquat-inducible protein A
MKHERYEPKLYIETAKESCHYCHNMTLQQVGNEKVCAHCGTRVYSTSSINSLNRNTPNVRLSADTR